MKKFLVFILAIGCLIVTFVCKNQEHSILDMPGIDAVCFVSKHGYGAQFGAQEIRSGDLTLNFCPLSVAKENFDKVKDVQAVELFFSSKSAEDILKALKCSVVSKEILPSLTVINAYTPFFANCVYLQNKKVNVQIALSGERVLAGFPVLLSGY